MNLTRYFFLKVSIISFIIALIFGCITYFKNGGWVLSLLSFLSIITIENIIYNVQIFNVKKGKLKYETFKLINKTIEEAKDDRNKIRIADKLFLIETLSYYYGGLNFNPDSEAIDILHKKCGIISITDAMPMEWLNPTYYFFLVNNLTNSLINRIDLSKKIKSIKYTENKDHNEFKNFLNKKKLVLEEIKELANYTELVNYISDNKLSVRFYLLKPKHFQRNKKIIELLISLHNMFGIYLFFINKETFDSAKERYQTLENLLKSVDFYSDDNEEKNKDFAISFSKDSTTKITYRKGSELIIKEMKDENMVLFFNVLKKISGDVAENYSKKDGFVLYGEKTPTNFTENNTYNHIYLSYEEE